MEKPSKLLQDSHNLILIYNIPRIYRAKHLRIFFSSILEQSHFKYFHYQHRPDKIFHKEKSANQRKTYCAFIIICENKRADLMKHYHNMHWLDVSCQDEPLPSVCLLKQIMPNDLLSGYDDQSYSPFLSRKEFEKKSKKNKLISNESDIDSLPEFNPPKSMPQGNVGTTTKHFINLVNKCLLPSSIISKLALKLYQTKTGIYSAVDYDYNIPFSDQGRMSSISKKRQQIKLYSTSDYQNYIQEKKLKPKQDIKRSKEEINNHKEFESVSDDDSTEEWDRFEAFHDDPHDIAHSKEKTYEEEMEVTWEKGGSGLVFYTDNSFWKELESTKKDDFFNDPTNYDLDIDMQNYYDPSANGDKDSHDLQSIHRYSNNTTEHIHDPHQFFKNHASSTAHRLMTKLGWKAGQSLGRSNSGLSSALDNAGQHPSNKCGLGYTGEKLMPRSSAREICAQSMPAWQRRRLQMKLRAKLNEEPVGDVYIASVFDIIDKRGVPLEESEDTSLRRIESGLAMKYYKDPIRFVPSHTLFKS